MEKGWISLSRRIQDCFIWEDKPFAKGQAWVDMLLLANHSGKKFLSKNEVIEVERGSFLTSDQRLADRWGWGRKKVRLFLDMLENEQMIVLKRNSKGTTINIVNYNVYQKFEDEKEHQKNNEGTSKEHQRNTNNNDNNDNNDNKKDISEKSSRFTPPTIKEVQSYCIERKNGVNAERFMDFYESKGWMIGKNKMKDWKAAVRTWEKKSKDQSQKTTNQNKFNNFPQRDYTSQDMFSMEQRLLKKKGL